MIDNDNLEGSCDNLTTSHSMLNATRVRNQDELRNKPSSRGSEATIWRKNLHALIIAGETVLCWFWLSRAAHPGNWMPEQLSSHTPEPNITTTDRDREQRVACTNAMLLGFAKFVCQCLTRVAPCYPCMSILIDMSSIWHAHIFFNSAARIWSLEHDNMLLEDIAVQRLGNGGQMLQRFAKVIY